MLFSGAIFEYTGGKRDATDEEVRAAADDKQPQGSLKKEEGYDSYIARGHQCLWGQKQDSPSPGHWFANPKSLVTIPFRLWITDALLRTQLATYAKDATIIVVAQRVSTILHADQILVLDQGKIVGQGTHETLLADCEVYQEIVASQFGEGAVS